MGLEGKSNCPHDLLDDTGLGEERTWGSLDNPPGLLIRQTLEKVEQLGLRKKLSQMVKREEGQAGRGTRRALVTIIFVREDRGHRLSEH